MIPAGKIGFRILPAPQRLSDELVAQYVGVASSNVADAMGRFNFMDPGIRWRSELPVCGRAVTVKSRPGDNLMVHKALEVAKPGDVIVVNTCGNTTSAVFGELMCHTAVAAGVGGLIVDGAVRDVPGITRLGLPVFSRTLSPGACDKDGPGEINIPISCGGTVVMAGDLVIGDGDGVAVVPRVNAEEVIALVRTLMQREAARIAEIARGEIFKREIDETLRAKGVLE